MTLEDFPTFARSHWSAVRQDLLDGTYLPQPVRRVSVPKPNGGERWLGIPSVADWVIQQAIGQVLTPIFDPGFSESSFGFRPGRCVLGAPSRATPWPVRQVQRYIGEGYRFAVDLDLEKFFDRVNHDVLMARVARKVRDKCLLGLIGRYLRAGVSKSFWHLSEALATQTGMTNDWLKSQGLISVRALWMRAHGYT